MVSDAWDSVSERWPRLLGGCRPIELAMLLEPSAWQIEHQEVLERWGVSSQLVVASPANRASERLITSAAVSRNNSGGTRGSAAPSFPVSLTRVNKRERDHVDGGLLKGDGNDSTYSGKE